MVSPVEWGCSAWQLLHGIAERIGTHKNNNLIRDEQNELRLTLRHFGSLLPCVKCQVHYREWYRLNTPSTNLYGEFLQDSIRKWVFDLHENVNHRRNVTSNLELTSLKELYSGIDLRVLATRLKSVYQRGVQLKVLKPDEWKIAWKHLDFLLRFIGV